jgi:hypothetical protein
MVCCDLCTSVGWRSLGCGSFEHWNVCAPVGWRSLGCGSLAVLSQILNIKLPSFIVLRRKEVKKINLTCNVVNRGLLILCTDYTYFQPAFASVVAVNCDPLGSLAPPLFSINELFRIRSSYMDYFRTQSPWLAEYNL